MAEDSSQARHDLGVLASQACESQDDHTIKLVEAALREFRPTRRPELLAVAVHRLDS